MESQIEFAPLFEAAKAARTQAYAPYSKFAVGAALLVEYGAIFSGCNIENVSLGLTICGERAAVFSAVRAGEYNFVAIAIVADIDPPAAPCGACRQVLAEFSKDLVVVREGAGGQRQVWDLASLLPAAFVTFSGL